jgi:CBS domain containing-hemolysin-like protein
MIHKKKIGCIPQKKKSDVKCDCYDLLICFHLADLMSVWNLLREFRIRQVHMAVVLNEYGGTVGVCSYNTNAMFFFFMILLLKYN